VVCYGDSITVFIRRLCSYLMGNTRTGLQGMLRGYLYFFLLRVPSLNGICEAASQLLSLVHLSLRWCHSDVNVLSPTVSASI
jgi:hypothetical protein